MKKYTEITDEAQITLEASRNGLVQGAYWLVVGAISLIAGDLAVGGAPLNLVVRDRATGQIVYSKGPLLGADAVQEAEEAARVIRVLGVQGYVDREQR